MSPRQQLWLPMVKPVNMGRGIDKASPLIEELWMADGFVREEKSVFFKDVAPGKLIQCISVWEAQAGLDRIF